MPLEHPRSPAWHWLLLCLMGIISGGAAALDVLASGEHPELLGGGQILAWTAIGALAMTALLVAVRLATRRMASRLALTPDEFSRLLRYDLLSYAPSLFTIAGAVGLQLISPVITLMVLAAAIIKGAAIYAALRPAQRARAGTSLGYLAFLFLISGFAALIYQIVWQRALFVAFGVNIESITIIISLFMFGLGIGSMAGGPAASRWPDRAPLLFLGCELAIGAFGIVSLPLIHQVSRLSPGGSLTNTCLAAFALLVIPTTLMGATLPILVGYLDRRYRNVGKSVGLLYCINTLGSAIACFLTADLLFVLLGEQACVLVAAACNITVGILLARYAGRIRQAPDIPVTAFAGSGVSR